MKIMLDAGHYANYNQGKNKAYYESKAMWTLTNYQKKYLEEYQNITVGLTRSNQSKDMAVYNRGYKSKGYDLFISNHSNASDSQTTDYPVVIRAYDNKNNAEVLGKKLTDVITKIMNTKQPGRTWTRKHNNGEYYGALRGARASGCPRYYIIEHSFHTNLKISTWLLNDSNLKSLAKAEVEAIAAYYKLKKKGSTVAPEKPKDPSTNPGKEYIIKVNTDTLNVRKGPSTKYDIVATVHQGEAYTIVDTNKNWGKLKSGIGWINLDYTKKK